MIEVIVPSISTSTGEAQLFISNEELDKAVARLRPFLPNGASDSVARAYLAESPVNEPVFREGVVRKVKLHVPPSDAQGLGFILSVLNTTVGSYLLTGYTTPIHKQDLATRTAIICQWSTARLPLLRAIFRSISGLARQVFISWSAQLYRMLDCGPIPKHIERSPSYDFKFHDFSLPSTPTTLSTDVVIIGSGCGAGVVASHLSRAGLKCLVLEKSYHFPSSHFPMESPYAGEHLMENGGLIMADDNTVAILAGSNFGGGGTVNWSASLQPQYAIRKEWASEGLPHFTGAEYQDCLDTVCKRMGVVNTSRPEELAKVEHNFTNKMLLEGARRLGMRAEIVPQNTGGKRHYCGFCTLGCPSATKQGPANCWFPDAAQHGAEFIEGAWVEEIVFTHKNGVKTATGVKATWTSRDRQTTRSLTVSAKRVVVAAGSLNSPLVLLRSGLTNPNIGRNLHLHPTGIVWSVFPHRTDPWEGGILTTAVLEFDALDDAHHGPKIEAMCAMPGMGLISLPFRSQFSQASINNGAGARGDKGSEGGWKSPLASAIDYRINAAKHGFSAGFISITRDADPGRVYIDPKDPTRRRLRVAYVPSQRDLRHILTGLEGGARISFAMGATEIDVSLPHSPRWTRPSSLLASATATASTTTPSRASTTATAAEKKEVEEKDKASFEAWLTMIRAGGMQVPDPCVVGSAHQMGTCRMSGTATKGVVDARGKVFGVDGLFVADASVFPSASGVNPMVSTMGIAEWIARGIVRDVRGDEVHAKL